MKSKGKPKIFNAKQIERMVHMRREEGLSCRYIASVMGSHASTISQYIRSAGTETHKVPTGTEGEAK